MSSLLVFNAKFASVPEGEKSSKSPSSRRLKLNAKFASLPVPEGGNSSESQAAKRLRRYYLQAVARELLPDYRVAECLRAVVPGVGCVNVKYSDKFKRAHYGNLIQCGSVWVCPVCSSKITERRRVEMTEALSRTPLVGVMVTLTFQHSREDKLADLQRDLSAAHKQMRSGNGWKYFRERWGVVGAITSTEVTYGLDAGWHLHKHSLYLVKEKIPDIKAIRDDISKRFEAIMGNLGRYVSPKIGVHVRATTREVPNYISKWGAAFEITKAVAKVGKGVHYKPFELLYLKAQGVQWAGEAFREYAAAMKGVNQLRWSPKLRSLLGLGQQPTDGELVEAPEETDRLLASLTLKQWGVILKREKRGELLEVASTGSAEQLQIYLVTVGVYSPIALPVASGYLD